MIVIVSHTITTSIEVEASDKDQAIHLVLQQKGEVVQTEYSDPSFTISSEVDHEQEA